MSAAHYYIPKLALLREAPDFNLQISLLERSETDRVLPRRNSGCRTATLLKRTSCCCICSATPGKSPISCGPEAKLGRIAIRVQ
ncbi:hypothetical protein ACSAZL_04430 [Methanosarcina sp. T3]|uniref:hypothetical protein n=1 Tax=Methanosarcina sp. T3 TaxID=3439062 RepID=UPI003F833CEF